MNLLRFQHYMDITTLLRAVQPSERHAGQASAPDRVPLILGVICPERRLTIIDALRLGRHGM
jgi:hypothetical protein